MPASRRAAKGATCSGTLVPAVRAHGNYKDPGPFVEAPKDVPIEQLIDLPLLIHEIFNNGA